MKEQKIKAYAVIWTQDGVKEYGVPKKERIIEANLDGEEVPIVDDSLVGVLAIFSTKEKADAYLKKNDGDFYVTPVVITFKA